MDLQRFLNWFETAGSRERTEGFVRLASAILGEGVERGEREAALSALALVLDDPSPKVRLAVADLVGRHARAPAHLIRGFLVDGETIAIAVVDSPLLGAGDLLDALNGPGDKLHEAIASRADLPSNVIGAIAERGSRSAVIALLRNAEAHLPEIALRRIAERHGGEPGVRALLSDRRLPPDIRQTLILETGQALQASPFVKAVLGSFGRHVVFDACERATATMAETMPPADAPAFVEHLRSSGQLSAALLLRAAAQGNINLLAAALTKLSGLSERRVRSVLVECRETSFHTLAKSCGLSFLEGEILRLATRCWKEISTSDAEPAGTDAVDLVMRRLIVEFSAWSTAEGEEALVLLGRLRRENARQALRQNARRLMAA